MYGSMCQVRRGAGGTPMTQAEATLIAGMELINDYEYQCERDPALADIVPLSSFLEQNL
jgi:hypothetical protein